MSVSMVDGPIIQIGYEYEISITASAAIFPAGCALAAHGRQRVQSAAPDVALDTGSGSIVVVSDTEITLKIAAADTEKLQVGTLALDVARTDVNPSSYLGFRLDIPVQLPVTRGV